MTTYVAVEDRAEQQAADPGQREDRLDDDGAAEQGADVEADDGQQREARRTEGVAPEHPSVRQALRPRHVDEVLLQGGDHVAAQEPHVHGDLRRRQRHGGQRHRFEVLRGAVAERHVARAGEVVGPHLHAEDLHAAQGEEQHEQHRHHVVGEGQHAERHGGDARVRLRAGPVRRVHAERDGDADRQDLGVQQELQGDGVGVAEGVVHVLLADVGEAEVALDRVAEPVAVLDPEPLVEAELGPYLLHRLWRGARPEGVDGGVPGQAADEPEREQRDQQEHGEEQQDPAQHVDAVGDGRGGEHDDEEREQEQRQRRAQEPPPQQDGRHGGDGDDPQALLDHVHGSTPQVAGMLRAGSGQTVGAWMSRRAGGCVGDRGADPTRSAGSAPRSLVPRTRVRPGSSRRCTRPGRGGACRR